MLEQVAVCLGGFFYVRLCPSVWGRRKPVFLGFVSVTSTSGLGGSPRVGSHSWTWRSGSTMQHQIPQLSCLGQEGEIGFSWDGHSTRDWISCWKDLSLPSVLLWVVGAAFTGQWWRLGSCSPSACRNGLWKKLREETAPCYFYPCTSPRGFRLTGLVMKPILWV